MLTSLPCDPIHVVAGAAVAKSVSFTMLTLPPSDIVLVVAGAAIAKLISFTTMTLLPCEILHFAVGCRSRKSLRSHFLAHCRSQSQLEMPLHFFASTPTLHSRPVGRAQPTEPSYVRILKHSFVQSPQFPLIVYCVPLKITMDVTSSLVQPHRTSPSQLPNFPPLSRGSTRASLRCSNLHGIRNRGDTLYRRRLRNTLACACGSVLR